MKKKVTSKDLHESNRPLSKEEFIERIKTDDEFSKKWGDLGPIYGKQWRSWLAPIDVIENFGSSENIFYYEIIAKYIDQIANLINDLKKNPDSRRLMVTAWNPADLPNQVLPPCHYSFQCYTRELTWDEQVKWVMKNTDVEWENFYIVEEIAKKSTPKRAISLMFNMRSSDFFLGVPFNIASYGLLLEILAKICNMVPEDLIGNFGDVHLYSNHLDQAKEQISRTFFPLPTLEINAMPFLNFERSCYEDSSTSIDFLINNLNIDMFKIINYKYHPAIKAPISN